MVHGFFEDNQWSTTYTRSKCCYIQATKTKGLFSWTRFSRLIGFPTNMSSREGDDWRLCNPATDWSGLPRWYLPRSRRRRIAVDEVDTVYEVRNSSDLDCTKRVTTGLFQLFFFFFFSYVLFLVKDAPSGALENNPGSQKSPRKPGEPENYENKRTRRTKSFKHFAIFYFHPNVSWCQSWGSYTADDPCISATKTYWPKPSTRIFSVTINKTKQEINFQSLRFILTTIMSPKILFLLWKLGFARVFLQIDWCYENIISSILVFAKRATVF